MAAGASAAEGGSSGSFTLSLTLLYLLFFPLWIAVLTIDHSALTHCLDEAINSGQRVLLNHISRQGATVEQGAE